VRSEKDPFTLMRMIDTNIFNTDKTIKQSIEKGTKKYFCVSTDKAANPVNMMGASKRIMEMFLMRRSEQIEISTARFANVAFSDGSLLHGFNQRILKKQPIVAPNDVKRYFVIPKESGELCLMSCLLGENRDIFFPKLDENLNLISFADIAIKYLKARGIEPYLCKNEDEARTFFNFSTLQALNLSTFQPLNSSSSQPFNFSTSQPLNLSTLQALNLSTFQPANHQQWPCLFTGSDTTGEKDFEEFFTDKEILNLERFKNLGVIKNAPDYNIDKIHAFQSEIQKMKNDEVWKKQQIVDLFFKMIPDFGYLEKGKYLDGKM